MLVVRIEIWPFGDESKKKLLAEGHIINTGLGSLTRGDYRVVLKDAAGREWKKGTVIDFPRKRLLAWDLLCRALQSILGERNPTKSSSASATES